MTTDQDDEDMASVIQDAARKWFGEHDREGVAFEYAVLS